MTFSPPASPSSSPKEVWTTALNRLSQQIRQHFVRPESHQRVLAYMQGLMSGASRKNGWQIAEEVGETTPYAIQHVLDRAKWDCDGVRDVLRTYVREILADPNGVVVIDETGFLKKGCKSVGVQRQYSGTAGRIENCQIGVFLAYASSHRHTLLDRELYLPKSWANDQARCREAHVPPEVNFATKPELAQRMLERTLDSGLPIAWVTGDTVYGSAQPLRAALEARKQAYALAVACKEHVEVQGTRKRVDQLASDPSREDWRTLSAGAGSKGPRLFAWARIELMTPETNGWQRWLLVRRSLDEGAKPAEIAYVLVFAPIGTSLEEMVKAFGARWTAEQCFEEATSSRAIVPLQASVCARQSSTTVGLVLQELVRVLAPGGPVMLLVKESDSEDDERYEVHKESGNLRFFARYHGSELWALLEQAGLQVHEITTTVDKRFSRWLGALAAKPHFPNGITF